MKTKKDFISVYFYKEPFDCLDKPLSDYRKSHLETVDIFERHDSEMVWRLLETVLFRDFEIELDHLNPKKLDTGRWVFDKYSISMSHSRGFYAIAISFNQIGIDVQKDCEVLADSTRWSKCEQELLSYTEPEMHVVLWSRKESLYKYLDPGIPFWKNINKIDTIPYTKFFKSWFYDDRDLFCVTICSDLIDSGNKFALLFDTNLSIDEIKDVHLNNSLNSR